MAKKTPILAIVICAMMMLPSHASAAWPFLEIIKGVASGLIGVVSATGKLTADPAKPPTQAAPSPKQPEAPTRAAPPTEEEIIAAMDQLTSMCGELSSQGFPCAIGEGRGTTHGNALQIASSRSISEMAKSMSTFVENHGTDIYQQLEDDGYPMDKRDFEDKTTSTVKQEVAGSQIYLTYSHTEEIKGKKVYIVKQVRVLNKENFEKAIEEKSLGKSLSQQLLDEAKRSLANKIKSSGKK